MRILVSTCHHVVWNMDLMPTVWDQHPIFLRIGSVLGLGLQANYPQPSIGQLGRDNISHYARFLPIQLGIQSQRLRRTSSFYPVLISQSQMPLLTV